METPAAPAAPAADVAPAPGPATAPEAAPAPEAPKPERTFTQAELDEIIEKRLGKERRKREDIERRLKITEELHLRGKEVAPQPDKPAVSGEPKREQFATYEEFVEAKAEWRADQRVEAKFKEREERDRERTAQEKEQQQRDAFKKAMKESAKGIEDFEEVMSEIKPTDPVANISALAVEATEAPGKVLYHLVKNPEEAERIASLPVGQQAREMLKLEATLSAKAPVKPSKAPEPIAPVAGAKAGNADEMPDPAKKPEEWLKWRNRQLSAKRANGARA